MSEALAEARAIDDGSGQGDLGNLRDLGGLPTADGRRIRHGLFWRAPGPERLTGAARLHLEQLQPIRVVDFRGVAEAGASGNLVKDGTSSCERIALPIEPGVAVAMRALPPDDLDGMRTVMMARYRSYISDHGTVFERFVRLMAERRSPVVFHCSAGKDRTGTAAALLLSVLGACRDDIVADYLESKHCLALPEKVPGMSPTMARVLHEVRPEYLNAALDTLVAHHGSAEAFAASALGSLEDLDAFRNWACS